MSDKTQNILTGLEKIHEWLETFDPIDSEQKFYYKLQPRAMCESWFLELDFEKREFIITNDYYITDRDTGRKVIKYDIFPMTFTNFEREHFDEILYKDFLRKAEYLILKWSWYKSRIEREYQEEVLKQKNVVDYLAEFEV